MANEKIEIEVLVNGKPAIAAINKVDKKTEKLGKTTKKTGKDVDGALTKMRAGWIAVGASVAVAVTKAASFERMSLGLTKAQKEWAKQTSLATDISAAQVAGFLKSAQTAGLAEEQMKSLAKEAIALGYAFPHESAETLHDNLVMLAKTGEAQGFVVDILEQKYVGLGEDITTLDLKTKSWSEKMKLVGEVAEKSQKQMDASAYTDMAEVVGKLDTSFTDLGDSLVTFGSDTGIFSFITTRLSELSLGFRGVAQDIKGMMQYFSDTPKEERIKWLETQIELLEDASKVTKESSLLSFGETIAGWFGEDSVTQLKEYKKELADLKPIIEDNNEVIKKGADQHKELSKTGKDVATGLADAFTNMVMGVKTSFKDMARGIIAQLVKIRMQALITKALTSFGIFHTGTAEVKHTGGSIGSTKIPSFHTGMRSDERLAKLQVGEAVINRGGASKNRNAIEAMNKGYAVGGSGGNVTTAEINFNVQAIDAVSFNSYLVNNRGTIESIINSSLASNGSVRRTIKQVI